MGMQWILVANESLARIFTRVSAGDPLVKVHTIDFPESRLVSRSSPSTSPLQNAGSRENFVHQFSRELAEYLQSALNDEKYKTLWIAAPNPFVEELQARLGQSVGNKLKGTYQEDLTGLNTYLLEIKLRDLRWIPCGGSLHNCTDGGDRFERG